MDTLTVDDVAEQPTRIIHDIEKGELALVTKNGRPLFVAVPVDEHLIKLGLPLALAIRLYEQETVSLGKAAQIAGVSVSDMIDHLGTRRIPVIRYSRDQENSVGNPFTIMRRQGLATYLSERRVNG